MIIGVIDQIEGEPTVIIGDTLEQVQAKAAPIILGWIKDDGVEYVDPEWLDENPAPDLSDADAVTAWLAAVKAATTDAWLDIFGPAVDRGDGYRYPGEYIDARSTGVTA